MQGFKWARLNRASILEWNGISNRESLRMSMSLNRKEVSLHILGSATILEKRRKTRRTQITSFHREALLSQQDLPLPNAGVRALSSQVVDPQGQVLREGLREREREDSGQDLQEDSGQDSGQDLQEGDVHSFGFGKVEDSFAKGPRVEVVDFFEKGTDSKQCKFEFESNGTQGILEEESSEDQESETHIRQERQTLPQEGARQQELEFEFEFELERQQTGQQEQKFKCELELKRQRELVRSIPNANETRMQNGSAMEQTLSPTDQNLIERQLLEAERLLFTQGIGAPQQMGLLSSQPCTRMDFSRDGVLLIYSGPRGNSGPLGIDWWGSLASGVTSATLLHYRFSSDFSSTGQRRRGLQTKTKIVIETSIPIDLLGLVPPATLEGDDFSGIEETHSLFSDAIRKRWLFRRENAFVVRRDRIPFETMTGIGTIHLDERDGLASVVVQSRKATATLSGFARRVVAHTPISLARASTRTRPLQRSFPVPAPRIATMAMRISETRAPSMAMRISQPTTSLMLDSGGMFHMVPVSSSREEIGMHWYFERSLPEYFVVDTVWDCNKRYVLVETENLIVDGHAVHMLATPVVFDDICRYAVTLERLASSDLLEIRPRMLVRPILFLSSGMDLRHLSRLGLDMSLIQDVRGLIAWSMDFH